jgi:membrane associated rhomboid family serine protease
MFILPVEEGNPTRRFPLVNVLLIAANVWIFFRTLLGDAPHDIVLARGFVPARPEASDVLTSMFLHGGLAHLAGNMYFLYVFGDNVEDRLGKARYLLFYLLCGTGAVAAQWWHDPFSTVPMIGASGAISGVCALYMLMFPGVPFRWVFFFLVWPVLSIPSNALMVVGLWFVQQYLMAVWTPISVEGGVAFWAHVGGFVTGVVLYVLLGPKAPKRRRRVDG